jgi:hypothetical protein
MPRIVVHNFWGTYSGDTPGEVLKKVHQETVEGGSTQDYAAWRAWNADFWRPVLGLELPTGNKPEEEQAFLDGLIKARGLTVGAGPAPDTAIAAVPGMR